MTCTSTCSARRPRTGPFCLWMCWAWKVRRTGRHSPRSRCFGIAHFGGRFPGRCRNREPRANTYRNRYDEDYTFGLAVVACACACPTYRQTNRVFFKSRNGYTPSSDILLSSVTHGGSNAPMQCTFSLPKYFSSEQVFRFALVQATRAIIFFTKNWVLDHCWVFQRFLEFFQIFPKFFRKISWVLE